ncbi:hypothetical protein AB205_0155110 [Aquarana catesbeiana]|uniref:Uncharacterized protein n=1 Tax=Aquarana catesbeiana TaxID=8400 RepID=A0A2G9S238_AQUCT|nr:hypothetical protein AB205_0155110 [Aquarana catesbeiana]
MVFPAQRLYSHPILFFSLVDFVHLVVVFFYMSLFFPLRSALLVEVYLIFQTTEGQRKGRGLLNCI